MRVVVSASMILFLYCFARGQSTDIHWYSETSTNGVVIQNSLPKGGPYPGPTLNKYNCSYLVFFTRVINETENPLELRINFSADSIAIPGASDTFVKLFLTQDTMSLDRVKLFSYGVGELESFDSATNFYRKINSKEEGLFSVVAFFYQTKDGPWSQERGGNRAELILEGRNLLYRMPPQIDSLLCGSIIFGR